MKIERLFQVLVVGGASTTLGLVVGCGSDSDGGGGGGTGGVTASGGSSAASGGSSATSGGSGASCDCKPDPDVGSWTDCNGCCCWLPAGKTSAASVPICGVEPCCAGNGR